MNIGSKINKKGGFTLLEMLLVIAIIAILAAIVIVAINPARQLAQARNAQRASDLNAIHKAVQQYYIDNKAWPTGLSASLQSICDSDDLPSGCLDLETDLVPDYLSAIPEDPSGGPYKIAIESGTNKLSLTAPSSTENGLDGVVIGTSTAALTVEEESCDATGGTISTFGSYTIHTFTSDGTFTVTSDSCTVDVLVVAGGGGGGKSHGGGGGGAGAVGGTAVSDAAGDGGIGVDYSSIFGTSVGDSGWFGGGGGLGGWTGPGGSGGTGGGGDGATGSAEAGEDGEDGTGGGGGAAHDSPAAGDGGSGVVIVRYLSS